VHMTVLVGAIMAYGMTMPAVKPMMLILCVIVLA